MPTGLWLLRTRSCAQTSANTEFRAVGGQTTAGSFSGDRRPRPSAGGCGGVQPLQDLADAAAGSAALYSQPCARPHPAADTWSRTASLSTPSAVTDRSTARAIVVVLSTTTAARLSLRTAAAMLRSIFSPSTGSSRIRDRLLHPTP